MGIAEDIALFEESLRELIIKYEQYFLGLEQREPLRLLNDAEALSRKYQNFQIVNTMMKFRYNAAIGRLNSYKMYWNRINRLIEDGKYSRDRFKMEMRQRMLAGQTGKTGQEGQGDIRGLNSEVEIVFRTYLEARKACNLPVDNITADLIAAAIEKQRPVLMQKYNCKRIEFKVVIEEGTPKIKARPKV